MVLCEKLNKVARLVIAMPWEWPSYMLFSGSDDCMCHILGVTIICAIPCPGSDNRTCRAVPWEWWLDGLCPSSHNYLCHALGVIVIRFMPWEWRSYVLWPGSDDCTCCALGMRTFVAVMMCKRISCFGLGKPNIRGQLLDLPVWAISHVE